MVNQKSIKEQEIITIRNLYPDLNEEELKEAEENMERYLELVLRIYERIRGDPEAYSAFKALTALKQNPTMKDKRSNPHYDPNSQTRT